MAAALAKLQKDIEENLVPEYYALTEDAQASLPERDAAATQIQALCRGVLARAMFKRYVAAGVGIQSGYRGMVSRKAVRELKQDNARKEREMYFATCALEIQRHWRGVHSRLFVHDFYKRKKWLAVVGKASEDLQRDMAAAHEKQKKETELQAQLDFSATFAKSVKGKHHLISTKSRPGIYNSPFAPLNGSKPTVGNKDMEEHLRDTLRDLPHIRPGEHAVDEALGGVPRVTIEKPKFFTTIKTQCFFDDYNSKHSRSEQVLQESKMESPQKLTIAPTQNLGFGTKWTEKTDGNPHIKHTNARGGQ